MNRFVLKNTFIKIYKSHFSINIFIITRGQSCFGDRVIVLNDFFYQHGGSTMFIFCFVPMCYCAERALVLMFIQRVKYIGGL